MATNVKRRKQLNKLLPEGGLLTRSWLIEQGFSTHAVDNLVKSEQIATVAPGVYTKWDSKPTWEGLVYFLQQNAGLNLTVGGLSALELQGLAHYLPLGALRKIHLYGSRHPPAWISKVVPGAEFEWHNERKLLGRQATIEPDQPDPLKQFTRIHTWKEETAGIILSSPERAILELLMDVPDEASFDHADQLMQGMTSLSPRSLQALLERCGNIKVRRLFFWLAERHQHAWLAKLQPETIDMGSGKRVLASNGKLDKKYNITIPRSL